jgi:hypothetical protein
MSQSRYIEHDYQLSNGAYVDFKVKEDANGTPVISELRITFAEGDLPVGGVGSAILREIRTSELMTLWFEESSRSFLPATQEAQLWQKVKKPWENTGRLKVPTELYAALAYFYLKYLEQNPTSPTASLAAELQIPTKTLQKRMTQARALGLLVSSPVSTPSGKAGGKLSTESKRHINRLLGE